MNIVKNCFYIIRRYIIITVYDLQTIRENNYTDLVYDSHDRYFTFHISYFTSVSYFQKAGKEHSMEALW